MIAILARLLARACGVDERRQRRSVRCDLDRRLAAWSSLSVEEQARWVHPASPRKPPEWTPSAYRRREPR